MKDKQLGGTKYIRIGVIKLPAGIFLGMTGQANAAVSVSDSCYTETHNIQTTFSFVG